MQRVTWLVLAVLAISACSSKESSRSGRAPGDKVDSLLPMAEYIRRFQAGLTEPTELSGGAANRDALARQYLTAISQRDTAALSGLLVSKSEYAWLVFPDHVYSRPPYELDPAIAWLQLGQETVKGATRVLQRYSGKAIEFRSLACERDTVQIVSGPDTVWSGCRVTYRTGDSTLTRGLFGSIVQRGGLAKFLSYHSEF